MSKIIVTTIIIISMTLVSKLSAQEKQFSTTPEIVVSPHNSATSYRSTASSVTVIEKAELKRHAHLSLAEYLKQVPSLDVIQSGPLGGNSSVFIRGTNPEHTLVLLDGVELNNVANNARSFNFAGLMLAGIEKIEILRGPQASLYGSDTIGGVINITTNDTKGQSGVNLLAGSYNTYREDFFFNEKLEDLTVNFFISKLDSHNISHADKSSGNSEKDSFDNLELHNNLKYQLTDNTYIKLTNRYQDSASEIDDAGGIGGDDLDRIFDNQLYLTQLTLNTQINEIWQQDFSYSYSYNEFRDLDRSENLMMPDFGDSTFKGEHQKFRWFNIVQAADNFRITAGSEYETEKARNSSMTSSSFGDFSSMLSADTYNYAFFLESLFSQTLDNQDTFTLGSAVRYDEFKTFSGSFNYRITPAYYLTEEDLKFSATYGTAFKAPSVNQLFSDFGNPDLEAEESYGYDINIEKFYEDIALGLTFFKNSIDQLINFDNATFIFENIDQVDTKGIESYISWTITDEILFKLNYSYLDTDPTLLRRADHKASSLIAYQHGNLYFDSELLWIDNRFDNDFSTFPAERVKLPSYFIVNLNTRYKISDDLALLFKVENLTDQNYQEVLGYGTRGLAFYGGLNFFF